MKDKVYNLAGGRGDVKRSITKVEFGTLNLGPFSSIGKHGHFDKKGIRHCEIYWSFSKNILINGKRRIFAICRNSYHCAENVSPGVWGKLHFLKLWW